MTELGYLTHKCALYQFYNFPSSNKTVKQRVKEPINKKKWAWRSEKKKTLSSLEARKKNTFLPPSFHPQPRKCAGLVNISGPVWLITVSWRSCGGWLVKAARWAPDMMLRWARNRTEFPHPRWATPPNSLPPYRLASPAHYRSSSFPRHINNRQAITCLLPLPGLCLEAEGSAASTVALLRWGEREEERYSGGETLQGRERRVLS